MLDDILTAIPFGIILAFTIGPVFFVLLETSVTKGFTSAVIFDLGVILADVVFILVIFKSTDTLLDKIKDDPKLLVFGGVLLVIYGLISFIKTSKSFRSIVREHMLISYFVADLFKIAAAKRLKNKLTPRRIFKTKKIVSLVILGFGILLLTQGLFPELYEKSKEQIEKVNPLD